MATIRIYELFPKRGSFSSKTIDYHGVTITVAATSISQAYALAHNDVWIEPDSNHPVGIVEITRRSDDYVQQLWCGCFDPGQRVHLEHGHGITRIRAELARHLAGPAHNPTVVR